MVVSENIDNIKNKFINSCKEISGEVIEEGNKVYCIVDNNVVELDKNSNKIYVHKSIVEELNVTSEDDVNKAIDKIVKK